MNRIIYAIVIIQFFTLAGILLLQTELKNLREQSLKYFNQIDYCYLHFLLINGKKKDDGPPQKGKKNIE